MKTETVTQVEQHQRVIREVMKLLPELGTAITRSIPTHVRHEGVSMAQVKAMVHLFEYGPQTMGDLADGLKITTPSATGLINPLAEQGFVVRDRDDDDAEEIAHSIIDQRQAEVAAALQGMSIEAQECFLEGLERLAAAYGAGVDVSA
jgi:DNA-binding MarR family transcriptional regulator